MVHVAGSDWSLDLRVPVQEPAPAGTSADAHRPTNHQVHAQTGIQATGGQICRSPFSNMTEAADSALINAHSLVSSNSEKRKLMDSLVAE